MRAGPTRGGLRTLLENALRQADAGATSALAAESVAVLTTRDTPESLAKQGAEVITSTPDELKMLVQKDIEKWSKVIQETGITAE